MDTSEDSQALALHLLSSDDRNLAMASHFKSTRWRGILMAKGKTINCIECDDPPFLLPQELHVNERMKESLIFCSEGLKFFDIRPLGNTSGPVYKWKGFNNYLLEHAKVAVIYLEEWDLFIPPPEFPPREGSRLRIYYQPKPIPRIQNSGVSAISHQSQMNYGTIRDFTTNTSANFSPSLTSWPERQLPEETQVKLEGRVCPRGAQVHPSHLETLEQMHASWLFGAVAELIDNARDAKATRLDISIENMVIEGNKTVPVLQVVDNGHGMDHEEIVRMLSFGHKRAEETDAEQIGHFGVGFKTGSMRLGNDALILTQSTETVSMGLLSKSHNSNLEVLEVPIVTYKKYANGIELDDSKCTREDEDKCKKAVVKHSPFRNDLSIGAQFAKLEASGKTGTRIYVYNLEQWEDECIFEWKPKKDAVIEPGSSKPEAGDIQIRSKRVRVRAGQISKEVPLDYSLRAYVEVLFLVPSMKIYLQGTPINTRSISKSFQIAKTYHYIIPDDKDPKKGTKQITLTLGKREVEYKRGNCGIFLYWHGRLIEAYKRVGAMVHSADIGRGIIGVMDVTDIMDFGNGKVGVLNNKQGFTDSDKFSKLERWLEETFGKYWDENFDKTGLMKKEELLKGEILSLENEWVLCNKCLKWRMMPLGWSSDDVVGDWFCYMKPFDGNCMTPETEQEKDVYTVGLNREGHKIIAQVPVANGSDTSVVADTGKQESEESSSSSEDIGAPKHLQRIKRLNEPVKAAMKPNGPGGANKAIAPKKQKK